MNVTNKIREASHPYVFFEGTDIQGTQFAMSSTAAGPEQARGSDGSLDLMLSLIKWTFLYVPGAAGLHMFLTGTSFMLFYGGVELRMIAGAAGVTIVCMFMIMIGIGKLSDLRYLRVVAAVIGAGVFFSAAYCVLSSFIPGDFFGQFARYTLPFTMAAGFLTKKLTDRVLEAPDKPGLPDTYEIR